MAVVNLFGAELQSVYEFLVPSGTYSFDTTTKRTGTASFRTNPTTTGTGYGELGGFAATGSHAAGSIAPAYFGTYFYVGTAPGSNDEPIMSFHRSGGVLQAELRINSSRNLVVYDSTPTLVSTGSTTLSTSTWYRLEGYYDRVSGDFYLWIDGSAEFALSAASTDTANTGRWRFGKTANRNSQTVDFYYDDAYLDDAANISAAYQIEAMAVDGNGNYTAWTGAYTDVDEIPPNDDTDYVTSSTASQYESVTHESASSAGISGTIHSVKVIAVARDEGGSPSFQMGCRSGTTDSLTSALNTSASYAGIGKIFNTDPNTGSAWTTSGLDGIESVVTIGASVATRVTSLSVHVLFTPAAGGATGTAAITNVNDTVSASGAGEYAGSAAITNTNDSGTAAAQLIAIGTAAVTDGDDTTAGTGAIGYSGLASITNADDAPAASGSISYQGSAAISETGDTTAGQALLSTAGSAAITNTNDTVNASGIVASGITGTAAIGETADIVSASGFNMVIAGTAGITEGADSAYGSGTAGLVAGLFVWMMRRRRR